MNPFTHSTVALPSSDPHWNEPGPARRRGRLNRRFGRRRKGGEPQVPGGQAPGQFEQESAHDDSCVESQERIARSAPFARLCIAVLGLCFSTAVWAVDVNVATPEQLRSVKGIGPKTAELIIEERTRGGRYESIEDLSERVKGIGPRKAAALQSAGLTVGKAASTSGAPTSASVKGGSLAAKPKDKSTTPARPGR